MGNLDYATLVAIICAIVILMFFLFLTNNIFKEKKELEQALEEKQDVTIKSPFRAVLFSKLCDIIKECDADLYVFVNISSTYYNYQQKFTIPFVIVRRNTSPVLFIFTNEDKLSSLKIKHEYVNVSTKEDFDRLTKIIRSLPECRKRL